MGFGVFVHRSDSIYDDLPTERYQFPRQYLSRVEACVGDWIVYYEPRKAEQTRGYFAIAKVERVVPDPKAPGMFLALIEPGSYLDFATPVPFSDAAGVVERGLLNAEGRISGRAQAAVRSLAPSDLDRILARGLEAGEPLPPRTETVAPIAELREDPAPFQLEETRERIRQLSSRIVRDRVFRRVVLRAYEERCAVSGLRLINGGGRAEVDAAHIRPVHADGPDIVGNGLALSGTAHWMFDRGLISISDDLEILISHHVNDPDGVRAFVNRTGRAIAPARAIERPHPHFLSWHRQNCFKA